MTTDNKQSVLTDDEIKTLVMALCREIWGESADEYTDEDAQFYRRFSQAVLSKLRGAGEPSDEEVQNIIGLADGIRTAEIHACAGPHEHMKVAIRDAEEKRKQLKVLLSRRAALASQKLAEGDAKDTERGDEFLALDLLDRLFSAWENGPSCYENPDSQGGFLGNAFRLDDETFRACVALLERRRPRIDAIAQQGKGAA